MTTTAVAPCLQSDPCKQGSNFPRLRTIKYSGSKVRLLPAIVGVVSEALGSHGTIVDLMAGTHCVGYALKQQYRIIANDVQAYSYVIGKAYVENGGYATSKKTAEQELLPNIEENFRTSKFDLFQKTYANTYFTLSQCIEIDSIRASIERVLSPKKELYLTVLMSAMCYASNTTGHFAEYLSKLPSSPKSIMKLFFEKCENLSVAPNRFANKVFNQDYKDLIFGREGQAVEAAHGADLVYIDPPYSSAQYSRFYHLLETIVRYDYPPVEFKGLYRKDRHLSGFCGKKTARSELSQMLKRCSEIVEGFVLLSYVDSNSCMIKKKDFEEITNSCFEYATRPLAYQVFHSKLGNGTSKQVSEYLILATNSARGQNVIENLNHHPSH